MPTNSPNDADGPERRESEGIGTFVPDDWFSDPTRSSVWLSAFRMARVGSQELPSGVRITDLNGVRAVMLFGRLRLLHASTPELILPASNASAPEFRMEAGMRETAVGAWLMFLTPFDVDGQPGSEVDVRRRIHSAAGLFAAFEGRNIVYEVGPENILSLGTGQPTVASPAIRNPFADLAPDVSHGKLSLIGDAGAAITRLIGQDRNRVELALHWFHLAIRDEGVDAFIKRWIALEVLAMPDGMNIRPVTEHLAATYGMSYEQARDHFRVGRLAGLRSSIVHDGQPLPIHSALELYIDAVFFDVLMQVLALPSKRRTEAVLEQVGPEFWAATLPQ